MRAEPEGGAVALDAFLSRDARNFRPSAIRAFAKLINDPNVISFAGGVPSPETFPADRVAQIADRVIREKKAIASLTGSPGWRGFLHSSRQA